jgi:hypothetical protein
VIPEERRDVGTGRSESISGRGLATPVLDGDPAAIALSLWVTLHGLVSLELAGALDSATADAGFDAAVHALLRGWAPGKRSEPA